MYSDSDIKIAGDKPSRDIKRNVEKLLGADGPDKAQIKKAKEWGKAVALEFIEDAKSAVAENVQDGEMLLQRRMLLSFTATVGFEQLCSNAGMILTPAGATYPYGKDPKNSNLRIAPSYPSVSEIEKASLVLCTAVKYAALEKLLKD